MRDPWKLCAAYLFGITWANGCIGAANAILHGSGPTPFLAGAAAVAMTLAMDNFYQDMRDAEVL